MKKATNLLIAFCAVLFMGCSSDDDNALAGVDPILGKWSLMTQYENEVPKELGDCQKDNFFEYVMAGSKGTKMPRGDKKWIMNYETIIPSCNILDKFSRASKKLQIEIQLKKQENQKLTELKALLLSRLATVA